MIWTLMFLCFLASSGSAENQGFGTSNQMSMEHLKEHYGNKIEIERHNSPGDRQFFYFQMGDTNHDHFLDGLELFKMIEHKHEEAGKGMTDAEQYEVQVDQVLSDFDKDGDGLISFSEYSKRFS
ncbi:unnamed protein product [Caenorhabditis sp. 36 PRJEB53466]|nr:unnamed protein product [Caenorhabditis sp. 36 PRJEB53466]